MKIAITTESASDMPTDLLKKYNVKTVPFGVTIGDEFFYDGEISIDEIFAKAKHKGVLPKTNAVNEFQYQEFFNNVLKEADCIIHFSLSSTISSAYNNAKSVADKMKNVYVIDTLGISVSISLLIIRACEMLKEGKTVEEIIKEVNNLIPKAQISLIPEKLNYLYKGGRCSAIAYFGSNILKIHPQIVVKNGKLSVGKKFRGNMNESVKGYCETVLHNHPNPNLEHAFVAYTTATDDMIKIAKNSLINRGFKNIYVTRAGTTIASHTGENTIAILFLDE